MAYVYERIEFNPFFFIIESKRSPHARTLRTSFGDKLSDVFEIACGGPKKMPKDDSSSEQKYLFVFGLFDYLTLGITLLPLMAGEYLEKSHGRFLKTLGFLCKLIFCALPRFIFSLVVVLLSIPIVGIVQLIVDHWLGGIEAKKEIMALEGTCVNVEKKYLEKNIDARSEPIQEKSVSANKNLKSFLKEHDSIHFKKINALIKEIALKPGAEAEVVLDICPKDLLHIDFNKFKWDDYINPKPLGIDYFPPTNTPPNEAASLRAIHKRKKSNFLLKVPRNNESTADEIEQKKMRAIHHLLRLNVGRMTTRLEEENPKLLDEYLSLNKQNSFRS